VNDLQPRHTTVGGTSTSIVVLPGEEALRLDQFLAGTCDVSRRAARRLIAAGDVLRNGEPTRVQSRQLVAGDVVGVLRPAGELGVDPTVRIPTPRLLHDDPWLVAGDKPAGVLSQPSERSQPGDLSFDRILLLHLSLRNGRRSFVRMVHRLDRATSGIVLFARRPQALKPLTEAWSLGSVDRRYLAVVEGCPDRDQFEIDRPIARDHERGWRFRVGDDGRPATTLVRVMGRTAGDLSVLECRLITGRTHQVRVHLSAVGHPVVGDRLYGAAERDGVTRPLLHAAGMALPHPKDGGRIQITSPPPDDMEGFLKLRNGP
jgi:23S rRNA pseudouridine1911/1915/1917 synthase